MQAILSLLNCILFLMFYHMSEARIFDKCSLAGELSRLRVPSGDIPHFICIAKYASNYDTQTVQPIDTDGARDWGIFEINDRWWCDPLDGRQTENACNIACSELKVDDISEAVRCAQTIMRVEGYIGWDVWNNQCQRGRNLPDLTDCIKYEEGAKQ